MVEVVCDTSFLIPLATKRIKNISNLETEIGQLKFVVPEVVVGELKNLLHDSNKNQNVLATLDFIKNLKTISISGEFVDKAIIDYVKKHGGIIATLDKELKRQVKNFGGSIISLSNDRIVLEP